jgi:hypothetical protein
MATSLDFSELGCFSKQPTLPISPPARRVASNLADVGGLQRHKEKAPPLAQTFSQLAGSFAGETVIPAM